MSRLESITSAANPLIKDVRRAIARGGLTDQGWCVAETFHLLSEALRSSLCDIKAILVSETARPTGGWEQFATKPLGKALLAARPTRIVVKPSIVRDGGLMNVRSLHIALSQKR